jgi:hypothetical protein
MEVPAASSGRRPKAAKPSENVGKSKKTKTKTRKMETETELEMEKRSRVAGDDACFDR